MALEDWLQTGIFISSPLLGGALCQRQIDKDVKSFGEDDVVPGGHQLGIGGGEDKDGEAGLMAGECGLRGVSCGWSS